MLNCKACLSIQSIHGVKEKWSRSYCTVFIRIVAPATYWSAATNRGRLLFILEGYLSADPMVSFCDRLVFQDAGIKFGG